LSHFQGAATGVGGILRDIFTMGARPFAVMDSLRFGPITPCKGADQATIHRNHSVLEGVVSGLLRTEIVLACPTWAAKPSLSRAIQGNPLVNAFALGLVRRDQIFYAKAAGEGTGDLRRRENRARRHPWRAMASEEFSEGPSRNVRMCRWAIRLLEKLLLEACVEAMHTGAVVGIQDMGAAGLTCSTCEMGARGGAWELNPNSTVVPPARDRHERLRDHAQRIPGADAAGGGERTRAGSLEGV